MGGPGDNAANVIPAPIKFNRSTMRRSEIVVESQLRAGHEMYLRVVPQYKGRALIPEIVSYEAFYVRGKGYVRLLHQLLPVGAAAC
jgi:hypothetical protein